MKIKKTFLNQDGFEIYVESKCIELRVTLILK